MSVLFQSVVKSGEECDDAVITESEAFSNNGGKAPEGGEEGRKGEHLVREAVKLGTLSRDMVDRQSRTCRTGNTLAWAHRTRSARESAGCSSYRVGEKPFPYYCSSGTRRTVRRVTLKVVEIS